ncbi:hypothetical protein N826_00105 [Skermanella aerolata KACC 11604]|nr:hypothetical protein N826_00105 [Skermanella aerolata KACC 11604]
MLDGMGRREFDPERSRFSIYRRRWTGAIAAKPNCQIGPKDF